MTDKQVGRLAKAMVLVLTLGALYLAIATSVSLVSLLLLGYSGVAQLFPGIVLGLFSKRVTTRGVFAGLAVGIAVDALLTLSGHDPYRGLNAGFIALGLNFVVTAIVSVLTPVQASGFEDVGSGATTSA